jgi:outer membrane protein, multidrug efflux system
MKKLNRYLFFGTTVLILATISCKTPLLIQKTEDKTTPLSYNSSTDTTNVSKTKWQNYFKDTYLNDLIKTALSNNQELNIILQEVEIAKNEIRIRKGEYLPFVSIGAGAGVEKVGRYTSQGANDANTEIKPGLETPEPLQDYKIGAFASWEIDIWKKLRNAKKAAINRYLASVDGKNFMVTNLIAEISKSYYELLALDNQLKTVQNNIGIQENALTIVRLQKESARATELGVKRFEAHVLNTRSMQFTIEQKIIETENKINFLVGRFPQHVDRTKIDFYNIFLDAVKIGIPAQLLDNRPDIKQAEMELAATKLDVQVAKARFYPSAGISAGIGFRAFNPKFLLNTPESLLYSIAGDLAAPVINRNAIKATYFNANAKQIQAVFNYQKTILNAYIEVVNQLSNLGNMQKKYDLKTKEVEALNQSVTISNELFKSTRADYLEVLLTQREAIESTFDLLEIKVEQLNSTVDVYRSLGGGWQ